MTSSLTPRWSQRPLRLPFSVELPKNSWVHQQVKHIVDSGRDDDLVGCIHHVDRVCVHHPVDGAEHRALLQHIAGGGRRPGDQNCIRRRQRNAQKRRGRLKGNEMRRSGMAPF